MARGALASGHDAEAVHLSDYVQGMLGDCRTCRNAAGACTIDDRYDELILEKVVHADALVIATPVVLLRDVRPAQDLLRQVLCYTSNSSPHQDTVSKGLIGKRVGVVISCEESYRGAASPRSSRNSRATSTRTWSASS